MKISQTKAHTKPVHNIVKRNIHNPRAKRDASRRSLKFNQLRTNLLDGTYEQRASPSLKKRLYFEQKPALPEPELIGAAPYQAPIHQTWIFNMQKQRVGITPLDNHVFNANTSRGDIIHQVVRWQLNKKRAGTTKQLNRREINGTGKKPFQQKGTGRARASTLHSPIHMGGARAHPKKIRDWSFSLPRKMKREAIRIALTSKRIDGRLFIVDSIDVPTHKTQEVSNILSSFHTKKALILHGDYEQSPNLIFGLRNNENYNLLPARGANVHDILRHSIVIMSLQGLKDVEKRLDKEGDNRHKVNFAVAPHAVLGLKPIQSKVLQESNVGESM